jgi:hypothetical protein
MPSRLWTLVQMPQRQSSFEGSKYWGLLTWPNGPAERRLAHMLKMRGPKAWGCALKDEVEAILIRALQKLPLNNHV